MGCCQSRPLPEHEGKNEQIGKSASSFKTDSSTSLLNSSSANNLILLLKSNYDSKDWKFLISQIPSKQKIHEVSPSPSWAKSPKTIGCLSFVYITKGCKKYPEELLPIFNDLHLLLLELLKNGSTDFKEQSILFINYLTILENPSLQQLLTDINIFPLFIPHFNSEKFELRHICASTCARIYKHNTQGQHLFLESMGVKALMHIILSGPLRGRFFSRLIQCLLDLLYSSNSVTESNVSAVLPFIDQSFINGVDVSLMNDPVREKFFELISLLSIKPRVLD